MKPFGVGRKAALEVFDRKEDEQRGPAEGERGKFGLVEMRDEPDNDLIVSRESGFGRPQAENVLELW